MAPSAVLRWTPQLGSEQPLSCDGLNTPAMLKLSRWLAYGSCEKKSLTKRARSARNFFSWAAVYPSARTAMSTLTCGSPPCAA